MSTFYDDVILKDPRFESATRVADLDLLEPKTRQLVQQIIEAAEAMGISLMVYETYRSQARQQELFDNGATKLRSAGVHNYGLACDIVRAIRGEPSWKGDFSFLGQLAHSSGLIWAGTGEIRTSNTVLWMPCTCNAAPSPGSQRSSLERGIPTMPTIPTPTIRIFCLLPRPHRNQAAPNLPEPRSPRVRGRSHNSLLSGCCATRITPYIAQRDFA